MPLIVHHFRQALRRLRHRAPGLVIARSSRLETSLVLRPGHRDHRPGSIAIGHASTLDTGVVLDAWGGSISIAAHVFLGPYVVIYGQGGVEIGPECLIAMHCRILSSNHEIPPPGVAIRSRPDVLKPTRLGRDVWLGAGVTVLAGVTIGDGSVVGAGAVVTKDIPPGVFALGIPARVVGSRPPAP